MWMCGFVIIYSQLSAIRLPNSSSSPTLYTWRSVLTSLFLILVFATECPRRWALCFIYKKKSLKVIQITVIQIRDLSSGFLFCVDIPSLQSYHAISPCMHTMLPLWVLLDFWPLRGSVWYFCSTEEYLLPEARARLFPGHLLELKKVLRREIKPPLTH